MKLKQDMAIETEESLNTPKERSKWRIHYMARFVGGKPQILQLAGKKYMEIYERRGFAEVSKEQFDQLVEIVKERTKP